MSDNIIKFRRPEPVKPPREPLSKRMPSWLKRVLVWAAVAAFFGAVFVYYQLTGTPAGM